MRVTIVLGLPALALLLMGSACQTVPVDRPCGVVRDSLLGVDATTSDGQQRLNVHFERGFDAGCWRRDGRML